MNSGRLFPLKIESIHSSLMAKDTVSTWSWHYRYGHLSFSGLKTLEQKNMVIGLPQITAPSRL